MNGITTAVGWLLLACGAGPGGSDDLGRAHHPGTGGTVLLVPAEADIDIEQVAGPRGPVVRLKFGHRRVQAPTLRFLYRGSLYDARTGPWGGHVTKYPKGDMSALRKGSR